MKTILSKSQLEEINTLLLENKIVYADLRMELLDHIASDIEHTMCSEGLTFEKALNKRDHFKSLFEFKSHVLVGLLYSYPSIVLKQLLSFAKRFYLNAVLGALILGLVFSSMDIAPPSIGIAYASYFVILLLTIAAIYIFFNQQKHKHYTVENEIYKRFFLPNALMYPIFVFLIQPKEDVPAHPVEIIFLYVLILNMYTLLKLHKDRIRKIRNMAGYGFN